MKILSDIFKKEITEIELEVTQSRLVQSCMGIVAVSLLTTAVMAARQPKQNVFMQLSMASAIGFTTAWFNKSQEELEKRFSSYVKLNNAHYKDELTRRYAYRASMNKVIGDVKLATTITEQLPATAQMRYCGEFNLHGLVVPQLQPTYTPESPNQEQKTEYAVSLQNDITTVEKKFDLDLSWIDSDFVRSSKVVVGGRGSGKSTYLRYEASRWLIENPGGILCIIDPHYDIDDQKKWWLNDIDQSYVAAKYIIKKREDIHKKIAEMYTELQDRIDNGLKGKPPIKIILDEEENIKRTATREQLQCFLDFLACVQDEGRKYLFEFTIGMHSMKKENTGIDSGVLYQMEWLLFGKACYDTTTRFPSDFDQTAIKTAAKRLNEILPKNVGRTVVIIKQSLDEPIITVLPLLQPPIIKINAVRDNDNTNNTDGDLFNTDASIDSFDVDFGDIVNDSGGGRSRSDDVLKIYASLVDWVNACVEKYNRYPEASHIKEIWENLTKTTLSEAALIYLQEKLYKDTKDPE